MKNPVMTLVKNLADRVTGARTAIGELRAADVALREALAAAETERGRLLGAKPPKLEMLQALDTELERLATEWTAQRGLAVVSALSGVCDVSPAGELRVVKYVTLADEWGSRSRSRRSRPSRPPWSARAAGGDRAHALRRRRADGPTRRAPRRRGPEDRGPRHGAC